MEQKFGEYTLGDVLGSGDMGTTYRAIHPAKIEPVALKILDKVDSTNTFKRGSAVEILEFAASLNHPRLTPIDAVVEVVDEDGGGQLGIAMPLSAAGSLSDLMKQGKKIAPKDGLKVLAQLASGIQYLHDQEVAHGSIKPSNVLFDAEGVAHLTDLPMAHLRELGLVPKEPTKQHLLFMAPEREYHASPEIIGDVFSLGVIAYLLLAGKMPFTDPDPDARKPIEQAGLPPAVAAVLRRELNPQLRFRYPTLTAFMMALKESTQGKTDPDTERLFGVNVPPPPVDEKRKTKLD